MEHRAENALRTEQIVARGTLGEPRRNSWRKSRTFGNGAAASGRPVRPGRHAAQDSQWNQILLLGDVCYCQPAERGFAIGLQLEHALLHTGELAPSRASAAGRGPALPNRRSQAAPVRKRRPLTPWKTRESGRPVERCEHGPGALQSRMHRDIPTSPFPSRSICWMPRGARKFQLVASAPLCISAGPSCIVVL